mmetsp:Transcript_24011/g.38696  ORF Transcript_24011/g.38696 Transcript_24011/m.38696 type:complete len:272 (-) Transcript_24011:444-1259(-)
MLCATPVTESMTIWRCRSVPRTPQSFIHRRCASSKNRLFVSPDCFIFSSATLASATSSSMALGVFVINLSPSFHCGNALSFAIASLIVCLSMLHLTNECSMYIVAPPSSPFSFSIFLGGGIVFFTNSCEANTACRPSTVFGPSFPSTFNLASANALPAPACPGLGNLWLTKVCIALTSASSISATVRSGRYPVGARKRSAPSTNLNALHAAPVIFFESTPSLGLGQWYTGLTMRFPGAFFQTSPSSYCTEYVPSPLLRTILPIKTPCSFLN